LMVVFNPKCWSLVYKPNDLSLVKAEPTDCPSGPKRLMPGVNSVLATMFSI
jgi:hypothetical protein